MLVMTLELLLRIVLLQKQEEIRVQQVSSNSIDDLPPILMINKKLGKVMKKIQVEQCVFEESLERKA